MTYLHTIVRSTALVGNNARLISKKLVSPTAVVGRALSLSSSSSFLKPFSPLSINNSLSRLSSFRHASTLISAFETEIEEFKSEESPISISEILGDSPFEEKPQAAGETVITLKNGNVLVSFEPAEFEHSGEAQTGVPMLVVIKHEPTKSQLSLACIARRNEETEEGEVEIEEVVVERLGGGPKENVAKSDKFTPYSPKIGELHDDLKTSFFEYLVERGIDNDFAAKVALIAEIKEEERYGKWLEDVKNFVVKEDAS